MLKRILKYIFVAIIICYSLFAMIVIPTLRDNGTCSEVLVDISKNNFETISDEEILEILDEAGINPELKKMDDIVCSDIEQYFNNISLIKECQVYKGNKDYLNIRIDCREPIIRIHDKNNNTYYVDSEGNIIKGITRALHLPIATGNIVDSMATKEIKEIASAIQNDKFWTAQIEQIYFNDKKEVIIIPRVGNHVIELGTAENVDKKLEKLYTFYHEGMNKIGWNKYSKLNIEFGDKVICTKRD